MLRSAGRFIRTIVDENGDGKSGTSFGLGASVGVNIGQHDTTAEIRSGATVANAANLVVSAGAEQDQTTRATGGAAGGTDGGTHLHDGRGEAHSQDGGRGEGEHCAWCGNRRGCAGSCEKFHRTTTKQSKPQALLKISEFENPIADYRTISVRDVFPDLEQTAHGSMQASKCKLREEILTSSEG